MKLGYKILILIAIVISIFWYRHDKSKKEQYYTKEVERLITNLRREDYFAIQNMLTSNLAKKISIESIKRYSKDLNLTRKAKFILNDYKKDNNIVKVKGVVVNNNQELPLEVTYKESNNTLYILEQKIGSRLLKPKEYTFPINLKSKE